jgi:hypothetical protein
MTNNDEGWDMDDTAKRVEFTPAPDDSDHPWYDDTEGGYTAHSPEEFEQWFNSLPTAEQKAFMDRITRLSEPVEYHVTDRDMTERLIEQYGEVTSVHSEDLGDFGIVEDTRPDEELDDLEYYGRYGWSRDAPICDDPECPCED